MKEKEKYDRMFSYFRYLASITIGAITILATIAGIFFGKDRSEMRQQIKETREEAQRSITQVEAIATLKIDSIRSSVNRTVNTTVNRELDDIFKTKRINELIEARITTIVKDSLKIMTSREIRTFNKQIQADIRIFDEASYYYRKVSENFDEDSFNKLLDMYTINTNVEQRQIIEEKLDLLFSVYQVQNYSMEKLIDAYGPSPNSTLWDFPKDIREADKIIKEKLTGSFHTQTIAVFVRMYNLLHKTDFKPYQYKDIIKRIE